MRKRIALAVAAIAAIAAILLFAARSTPPVTLTFVGRESGPGLSYRRARFDVANSGRVSIFMERTAIHVRSNGVWKVLPPGVATKSEPFFYGGRNINSPTVVEPGETKPFIVEWTEGAPWRIELIYRREAAGVSGVAGRAWFGFNNPEFAKTVSRTNRMWISTGTALSREIYE